MLKRYAFLALSLQLVFAPAATLAAKPAINQADAIRDLRSQALEKELAGFDEEALQFYEQAAELAGQAYGQNSNFVAEIYYDMGQTAIHGNKFEPAENYLKEALHINPNLVPARLKLAELLQVRNRPDEALKQAQMVLAKQRGNTHARFLVASSYTLLGNPSRAAKEYNNMSPEMLAMAPAPVALPTPAPEAAPPPAPKPDQAAQDKTKADKAKADKAKADQEKADKAKADKEKADKAKADKAAQDKAKADKAKADKAKADKAKADKTKAAKPKPTPPPVVPVVPAITPMKATMDSSAVLLTKIPKHNKAPETKPAETEVIPDAPKPPAPEKPKPAKPKGSSSLVPPPPPVPVIMPGAPPPQVKKVEKPAEKPAEKPVEKPKPKPVEKEDEGPGSDDPSFLLDWADTKAKKKK